MSTLPVVETVRSHERPETSLGILFFLFFGCIVGLRERGGLSGLYVLLDFIFHAPERHLHIYVSFNHVMCKRQKQLDTFQI